MSAVVLSCTVEPADFTANKGVSAMNYQVTPARLKAWQHPLVQVVTEAADKRSDDDFKRVLKDAVSGNWDVDGKHDTRETQLACAAGRPPEKNNHFWVAWNGFMPLPFTEDSVAGKRLVALWAEVKKEQPNCAQVQEFKWLFWRPERDDKDAAFLAQVLGRAPVYHELAV